MSDTDGKKPLGLGGGSRSGQVKQSFSHGRTKSVLVETKRKRVVVPKPGASGSSTTTSSPSHLGDPAKRPAGISDAEMERRLAALRAAKLREVEDAKRRADEERQREEERQRRREELEAKEREERERAEALRQKAEDEERARREAEEAARRAEEAKRAPAPAAPQPAPAESRASAPPSAKPGLPPSRKEREREADRDRTTKKDDSRRSGELTLNEALSGEGGRTRSLAAMKRKQEKARQKAMGFGHKAEKQVRDVQLPETILVQELANRMAERAADVVKALMKMGMMVTMNQSIDADTAELVIEEFGHRAVRVSDADVEHVIDTVEDKAEDLQPRPPIITIMGHVDHGKTSLLDAIRKTSVVSGEAGGITQHIGAYQVKTESGAVLTFLDTPGHAAFTSMRARGAQVTDIVVLVVAADDAVMPQTVEAIKHAKAAKVPMIVAINKIDKPDADPNKVRTDLLQHEVIVEKMSGDVLDVEVSAKTGLGLDELLENIALQAEILDLRANPSRQAQGAVIEAKLDVGRGPVATVLVQYGTLKRGDIFVVGQQWGKVRALINDKGERVDEAGPSVPVEVLGLNGTPEAGDVLNVVETEAQAREIADYREKAARDKRAAAGAATTLEQLMAKAKADADVAELPVVIKADVQGLGRGDRAGAGEGRQRRGPRARAPLRRGRDHRDRHHAGRGLAGGGHRLQRPGQCLGTSGREPEERRDPLLQRDLRLGGRCEEGGLGPAQGRSARAFHRLCADQGSLPHHRRRQRGGLYRHRGRGPAVCRRAPAARQHRDPRGHAEDAQALQGRGQGSAVRAGMRHGLRTLRRHPSRRRDRDLRARGGPAQAGLIPDTRGPLRRAAGSQIERPGS